jgi:hypothetical protein
MGNSTMPCPRAIRTPAILLLAAFCIVIANNGPGIRTPLREIITTELKNM